MTVARSFVAVVLVTAGLAGGAPSAAAGGEGAQAHARIIVQAPGAEVAAAAAVHAGGGTVTQPLPIVSGFAATVPAHLVGRIAALDGVRAVTPDGSMHPAAKKPKPPKGGGGGGGGGNTTRPSSVYRTEIGADAMAATGDGVTVALVDTGVTPVGDIAGRLVDVRDPLDVLGVLPAVPCVNFSGETTCNDTYGHGTFMAGLIAGSGAASGGTYMGVAPGAEIVSVKVGGADGSADVSKVLAGIQWVVSFAQTYDIKVLNLSLGSDSTAPPSVDPLNLAVQRAWVEGITVVVSAGNLGPEQRPGGSDGHYGTVTKPGDDPFVITVGAVDDMETTPITDDRLPGFTSWGPTFAGDAKPDVVAPGARLVSLRAPDSAIDALPGIVDGTYRRGSGTSMAAAVVSGLAAQLLEAQGTWQPDDVKTALLDTARPVASNDTRAVGEGMVYGPAAEDAEPVPPVRRTLPLLLDQGLTLGSLADSSGGNLPRAEDASCLALPLLDLLPAGECTAQGRSWHGGEFTTSLWSSQTWYLSQWVLTEGRSWHSNTWAGRSWHGGSWQGSTWYGSKKDKRSYGTTINGSGSYGAWG